MTGAKLPFHCKAPAHIPSSVLLNYHLPFAFHKCISSCDFVYKVSKKHSWRLNDLYHNWIILFSSLSLSHFSKGVSLVNLLYCEFYFSEWFQGIQLTIFEQIFFFLKTKQGKTVLIFCILYLMHIFFVTPSCWVKEMISMGNYEQGLFFSFNLLFLWFWHYLLASMQRMKFLITFSRCWINIMPFWQGNLEKLIVINLPFYLFTYLFVCLFIHLFCFLATASPPCPSPTFSLLSLHRLLLHFFSEKGRSSLDIYRSWYNKL